MTGPSTLLPFQPATMSTAQLAAVSTWPATRAARTSCTPSSCGSASAGARTTGWIHWLTSSAPMSSCTSGGSAKGLIRFLQSPDLHRPPCRPGLPAGHQRPASLRSRGSADRGLHRHAARVPGAAPGRQGQQARHHAADCPGAAGAGGVPPAADGRTADPATGLRTANRPARCVPDGRAIREDRVYLAALQPHSLRHAAITNALDAGVPLRDAQILARHSDPRTTEHYDRARGNLDRQGVHFLTAYVAGSLSGPIRACIPQERDGEAGITGATRMLPASTRIWWPRDFSLNPMEAGTARAGEDSTAPGTPHDSKDQAPEEGPHVNR